MAENKNGIRNMILVMIPKAEIGAPKIFDTGLFVAASQLRNDEMSQIPPSPIPEGK